MTLAHFLHIESGSDAVDFLLSGDAHPHPRPGDFPKIIFMSVNLPKLSGLDVLKRLKQNELTRTIPVVMLISSMEAPCTIEAIALGCDDCILKSLNFDEYSVSPVGGRCLLWGI